MRQLQGDWLDAAKTLQRGVTIRSDCTFGCGGAKSEIISHTIKGYTRHCFRCGESDFKGYGIRSISEIMQCNANALRYNLDDCRLPKSYTTTIPTDASIWLLKSGISIESAMEYGIGWDTATHRIVLPCYSPSGELEAMQLRTPYADVKPKYINPKGPKVRRALFYSKFAKSSKSVVVVEDILSAIKVGQLVPAVSILGTTMTDERTLRLADEFDNIIIWLDNDKAGAKGTAKAIRQLQLVGCDVFVIHSDRDPKTYNTDEINEYLKQAVQC